MVVAMMSAGLCVTSWVLNRESEPVPLLWLGVLIRQLETDRRVEQNPSVLHRPALRQD